MVVADNLWILFNDIYNHMEKIKIGEKTYKLNIEKAKELGLLEEVSTFRISTDYKTGAMVISE